MFIINTFITVFTFSMIATVLFYKIKLKDIIVFIIVAGGFPFLKIIPVVSTLIVPIVSTLVIILLYTIIIMILQKESFHRASIKTIISFTILIVVESILYIIITPLNIDEPIIKTIILALTDTLVVISLYSWKKKSKIDIGSIIDINNKWILIILIGILWISLVVMYVYYYNNITNKETISLFIGLIVFIIFNLSLLKAIYKMTKDKETLQIQNEYNLILDNCMLSLRANDHEYKNHLNTIYTTLQFGNEEELRDLVRHYVEEIKNKDSLTKLMYVDNVIIRAIIYNKIIEADKANVKLKYNIKSSLKDKCISDLDLVIIVTNLLNNAIEAAKESDGKIVELRIEQDFSKAQDKYIFTVKNTVKDLKSINISSMFKKGFSTKGEDRGHGLSNVQKTVKDNCGDIIIDLIDDMIIIEVHI